MVQPYNYGALLAPTTPLDGDAFLRGAQSGQVLVQNAQNRQIAQAQAQEAQVKAQIAIQQAREKAEYERRKAADLAKLAAPGTPLSEFARTTALYPEISEQLKRSYDMLSDAEKKTKYEVGARALALVEAGDNEAAAALLEEEAERNKVSGREEDARTYGLNAQALRKVPTQARALIGTFMASADPEKFAQIEADIRSNPAVVTKREAEADKSTIESLALGKEKEAETDYKKAMTAKIRAETAGLYRALNEARGDAGKPLETDERKSVNEAAKEAVTLGAKAEGLRNLASRIEREAKAKGTWQKAGDVAVDIMDFTGLGRAAERKIRTWTGNENEDTILYNEFERFKASGIVDALPTGAASDNDIKLIKAGFPGANANDAYKAKWLNAYANVTEDIRRVKRAETLWQSANQGGGLGPAQRAFVIDGKKVKPGMSFVDFVAKKGSIPDELVELDSMAE